MILFEDNDSKYELYRQCILENCRGRKPARWNQIRYDIEARHYTYPLIDRLINFANLNSPEAQPGQTALDVGCGHGTLSLLLAKRGFKTTTLDRTEINIPKEIFAQYNIQFVLQDICQNFNMPSNSFNLVIFAEVLEHLPSYHPKILRNVRNCMKPDGLLFISKPDREGDWPQGKLQTAYGIEHFYQMKEVSDFVGDTHYYVYNLTEFHQLCEFSGFKIISLDSVLTASGRKHIYAVLSPEEFVADLNEDPTALNL